jgi:hypothetical protein
LAAGGAATVLAQSRASSACSTIIRFIDIQSWALPASVNDMSSAESLPNGI